MRSTGALRRNSNFKVAVLIGVAAVSLPGAAASGQTVVFNSLTTGSVNGVVLTHEEPETSSTAETASPGGENLAQIGQRLNLAGAARHITRIDVRFGGFTGSAFPQRFDGVCRLFTVGATGAPGSLLWEGLANDITFPTTGTNRQTPFSFFPEVDVPSSIFMMVSEADIVYGSPSPNVTFGWAWRPSAGPNIGTAGPWAAQDTTTSAWITTGLDLPPTNSVLEARITAVPTPSTAAACVCGLVVMGRRRRNASNRPKA